MSESLCPPTIVNDAISGSGGDQIINASTIYPIPAGNPTYMDFPWTYTTDNTVPFASTQLEFLDAAGNPLPAGGLNPALSLGHTNQTGTLHYDDFGSVLALGAAQFRTRLIVDSSGIGQTYNITITGTITWAGCTPPAPVALASRFVTIVG